MIKNIGVTDRVIRITLAIVIAILYFTGLLPGTWALALGIIAILLIITSFIRFCPLYWPFGLSTLGRKRDKEETGLDKE